MDRELNGDKTLLDSEQRSTSSPESLKSDLFRLSGWDILEDPSKNNAKSPVSELSSETGSSRAKSSLRLRYEAEVTLIKKKLGNLEEMREKLGLSQRKICQLLLVDPSAWTRWTKAEEDAPPHIYRMLQWYLALQDKYPALDVNFWLSTVSRTEKTAPEIRAHETRLKGLDQGLANMLEDIRGIREEIGGVSQPARELEEFGRRLDQRLAMVRRRERLVFVWVALFIVGVVCGFLVARF